MNILITGGTGFFGKALLRVMRCKTETHPAHVTVLSRNPEKFLTQNPEFARLPWLDFIEGDILQAETLPYKEHFMYIIHAAADSTLGPQLSPLERYDQIVSGTRNILDYAVKTGIKRVLYTSSGGIYGKLPADIYQVNETYTGMPDPLNPENAYGVAKREAEHLCTLYADAYGLDYVIARCFAFVGQDLPIHVHFAIGNFIRDALFKDSIQVNGDGSPMRSYMAQQDLAEWLLALLQKGQTKNAYNVGSDEMVSIRNLAYLVRDIVAPEKEVHILGGPNDNSRDYYIPDIAKAKQQLGLKVSVSLKDAILQTAQTLKACHETAHYF